MTTTPEMVHAAVGISSADSIKVAVRVRPLNSKEVAANLTENVNVAGVRFFVRVFSSVCRGFLTFMIHSNASQQTPTNSGSSALYRMQLM